MQRRVNTLNSIVISNIRDKMDVESVGFADDGRKLMREGDADRRVRLPPGRGEDPSAEQTGKPLWEIKVMSSAQMLTIYL